MHAPAGEPDETTSDAGDRLVWSTPMLGALTVPLESLRRVVLREHLPQAAFDPLHDVLVLANGDRLLGLLETIWPQVVMDVQGTIQRFDPSAVASITLANPPAEPTGTRLWLSDGSILDVSALRSQQRLVRLTPASPVGLLAREQATVTMGEILAVAFERHRVRPLASLGTPQWMSDSPWAIPPGPPQADQALLGMAPVELVGPGVARWTLPQDARRLALRLRLREDCRVWGDCTVTVGLDLPGQGEKTLAQHRLHDRQPQATVAIDLAQTSGPNHGQGQAATLWVRIDEGQRGAIQDRVLADGFVRRDAPAQRPEP
ncbi:MAG: hypothetical protein KatS3mg103_0445 [Phycisphaerales bacterium]|nr:MAG: hypothetical protein KatS3mg103_0445 [Phycisphaerales bacterium]